MRYGNEEASTHRTAARRAAPVVSAPEFLDDSLDDFDPPTHLPTEPRRGAPRGTPVGGQLVTPLTNHSAHRPGYVPAAAPRQPHEITERSVHQLQPSHHSVSQPSRSRSVKATPAPAPAPSATPAPAPRATPAPSPRTASQATPLPAPPPVAPAEAPSTPSSPSIGQMGMIDPLSVPVPPELAPSIYGHIRRLALQADLPTADRVLRDALLELSSSLSVSIIYPGQDGLWTLGGDDEIPREAGPIVAVAQARRAVIASHTALIPIVTTSETVGVILLTRNPRNPGYLPVEQLAVLGLARECAAILHHLAVQHLQQQLELKADKGSLYRPEALAAHRSKGTEGELVQISPAWVKRAYPMLVGTILVALLFALFVKVPTYSTGSAIIVFDGTAITSPAMGTVDQVLVQPGQAVKVGSVLVRLQAAAETDELVNAKAELDNATRAYLFDESDANIKKQLASAYAQVVKAQSRVDQRTVRATRAGTVSDIRVRTGAPLQPGDHILSIVDAGLEPEVVAFLPSKDRPRLRTGLDLQLDLLGYTKAREKAQITFVSPEAIGANEAAKYVGATIADALKLPQGGSYVIVKARLPKRTFQAEHHTYHYHHGMQAITEVKVSEKPFLVDLLPALEKYLPE